MSRKNNRSFNYNDDLKLDLENWGFLGKGHNGTVYRMSDEIVIKICLEEKSCRKEADILAKAEGSKFFPKIYECGGNYMIRDYVAGECMKDYIKSNGLSRELAVEIIKVLEEFKRLNFTKVDIRCKDLFVQKNGTLMIIDPKGSYSRKIDYPRHLCKGLRKLGVLDVFLQVLMEERLKLYREWAWKIYRPSDVKKEVEQ